MARKYKQELDERSQHVLDLLNVKGDHNFCQKMKEKFQENYQPQFDALEDKFRNLVILGDGKQYNVYGSAFAILDELFQWFSKFLKHLDDNSKESQLKFENLQKRMNNKEISLSRQISQQQ
ncbi:hypothetical protein [Candidatus Gromoviella agglomerans]|uniref:hypothetical protein n=1 Tax=Candidatus Gromoviella agglomerans TaxID=2806609 RepID=UPI001E5D7D4D|nr:hypothetical protein [Candidatus Gromoviella agglomerans]